MLSQCFVTGGIQLKHQEQKEEYIIITFQDTQTTTTGTQLPKKYMIGRRETWRYCVHSDKRLMNTQVNTHWPKLEVLWKEMCVVTATMCIFLFVMCW